MPICRNKFLQLLMKNFKDEEIKILEKFRKSENSVLNNIYIVN